jgi:hypothetical protein
MIGLGATAGVGGKAGPGCAERFRGFITHVRPREAQAVIDRADPGSLSDCRLRKNIMIS